MNWYEEWQIRRALKKLKKEGLVDWDGKLETGAVVKVTDKGREQGLGGND
jgi:DNA-binding PadR family transcriptional regulator